MAAKPPKSGAIFRSGTTAEEKKVTFAEAFPEVDSLSAEIIETGPGNSGLGVRRFQRTSFREYINCSNVQCSGRGLPLGDLLRDMVSRRQKSCESHHPCAGHQDSKLACPNAFHIDMEVFYK